MTSCKTSVLCLLATSACWHGLVSATEYTYTTSNSLAYMCSSNVDTTGRLVTCGQAEYPAGENEGVDAVVSCSSGTIECFVFASTGKVGGSCSGDPFMEDPGGEWAYLPESVGTSCQNQASCTITVGDGTLNSVATSPSTVGYAKNKFKAVALCSSSGTTGGTDTTTEGSTTSAGSGTTSAGAANVFSTVGAGGAVFGLLWQLAMIC